MLYCVTIDGLTFTIQVESQDEDAKLHALVERLKQAGFEATAVGE